MTEKWLTIVGMGQDGMESLSPRAKAVLAEAEVIIGSQRLLRLVPDSIAERHEWPQPFSAVVDRIKPLKGRKTVVLATGDPSNYGVARKLLTIVPFAETEIIPHISSFSLAAARMGWALPDCDTLTLHGRPSSAIEPFIQPGVKLIALTEDGSTVSEVARRLCARGYGQSMMTVLEDMGAPSERRTSWRAQELGSESFSNLNTIAIECIAGSGARHLPRGPGLPDEAFAHDGQITKRDVRAITLAALAPSPEALLWDVGAGCGSVAIEWMRMARGAAAIAIEREPARLAIIKENAEKLGTPRLNIVAGQAPPALKDLPAPDAVFIGGGLGDPGAFEDSWAALKPGGRMVINVVTLEGELHLIDLQEKYGGDIVRIELSHLGAIGKLRALKPRMAVLQWRAMKPW